MSEYVEFTSSLGDRLSDAIKRAGTAQTDAIAGLRDRLGRFAPDLTRLPFAGRLPEPEQAVRANFALLEQLLRAQQSYALALIDAFNRPTPRSRHSPRSETEAKTDAKVRTETPEPAESAA